MYIHTISKTLSPRQNGYISFAHYGSGFSTEFRHLTNISHLSYLIGFEKNVVLTETGSAYVLMAKRRDI